MLQLVGCGRSDDGRSSDDSASLLTGAPVTAIGNAGGVGGAPTVTTGKVVALHQSIAVSDDQGGSERLSGLIETNASLQPGDSGGPLLDAFGKVIGMDTAASTGFQFQPGSGQGFAIPIDHALAVARQIEAGQSAKGVHIGATPFIGIDRRGRPGDGFGPRSPRAAGRSSWASFRRHRPPASASATAT